jgi:hypothetical protein
MVPACYTARYTPLSIYIYIYIYGKVGIYSFILSQFSFCFLVPPPPSAFLLPPNPIKICYVAHLVSKRYQLEFRPCHWLLWLRKIPSSGMWRRVALVRNRFSEEHITSIIRVTIFRFETTIAVTSNRITLQINCDWDPSEISTVTPVRCMKNEQTPCPLVRERTIPTERLPLVDEIRCMNILANFVGPLYLRVLSNSLF